MVFDILVFAVLAYFYKYREESTQMSSTEASPLNKLADEGAENDTLPLEERPVK